MLISTRGRYALRVMADIAANKTDKYVPLKEISLRQDISLKYLEGIMSDLSKANLVIGLHGKGGGYKLSIPPDKITVGSVLKITEGTLAPVTCLSKQENDCPRKEKCKTLPMWEKLYGLIDGFFESVTINDLL